MLLASTREWLGNRNTLKVLTKIQVSKSILQFATNCVIIIIIWSLLLENKVTMKSHRTKIKMARKKWTPKIYVHKALREALTHCVTFLKK